MVTCIFEDELYTDLYPITYTRPTFDVVIGMTTILEKIIHKIPSQNVALLCRDYLKNTVKRNHPRFSVNSLQKSTTYTLINGRVIIADKLANKIRNLKNNEVLMSGFIVVAAKLSDDNAKLFRKTKDVTLSDLTVTKLKVRADFISNSWELAIKNPKQLTSDIHDSGNLGTIKGKLYDGVYLINKKQIHIARGVKIKSGTVIDAESGPVYIDRGTTISPNVTITGPVYIGEKCTINAGAKILYGTTIGESSKVGGEIAESIIHGFSNKQHDGFLGHSYIGTWCNLGANTNNSDLKNNYSSVELVLGKKKIDTKELFVGLIMGDHSKTGINTMFNTGTVVGVGCNIVGAGYPPKYIPSFTWMNLQSKPVPHNLTKFFETARAVYKRRKVQFTAVDKKMYTSLFNHTKKERKSL